MPDRRRNMADQGGQGTNGNESFPVSEKASLIGVSSIGAVNRNEHAAVTSSRAVTAGTRRACVTNQAVDASTNPVTTSLHPDIVRRRRCRRWSCDDDHGAFELVGELRAPVRGLHRQARTNCGDSTYLAQDFGPAVVTFSFQVADAALKADPSLPKGYKIEKVFHNDE